MNFALWSFGNWGFWLLNFRFLYHSILKNQVLCLALLPQLKSRRGFERNFFKLCVWDDFIILRIGDVGWVRSDELWIYQIILLNPIIIILFHFTFTLFNFLARWLHTNNNFWPTKNNFFAHLCRNCGFLYEKSGFLYENWLYSDEQNVID